MLSSQNVSRMISLILFDNTRSWRGHCGSWIWDLGFSLPETSLRSHILYPKLNKRSRCEKFNQGLGFFDVSLPF